MAAEAEWVAELGPGRELHRGALAQHRHRQHQFPVVDCHCPVLLAVLVVVARLGSEVAVVVVVMAITS